MQSGTMQNNVTQASWENGPGLCVVVAPIEKNPTWGTTIFVPIVVQSKMQVRHWSMVRDCLGKSDCTSWAWEREKVSLMPIVWSMTSPYRQYSAESSS